MPQNGQLCDLCAYSIYVLCVVEVNSRADWSGVFVCVRVQNGLSVILVHCTHMAVLFPQWIETS